MALSLDVFVTYMRFILKNCFILTKSLYNVFTEIQANLVKLEASLIVIVLPPINLITISRFLIAIIPYQNKYDPNIFMGI